MSASLKGLARTRTLPFFGRVHELALVEEWIGEQRPLISITGPPGVGKSRLVAEVRARRPGVATLWCSLAHVTSAADAARRIGDVLGVGREAEPSPRLLATALAARIDALLILDEVELVAPQLAPMLEELLAEAPSATILLTSRVVVGAPFETALELRPFEVPTDDSAAAASPAFALWLDRAKRADASYMPDDTERDAAFALLRHVNGLPLAIELAAAQTRVAGARSLSERVRRPQGILKTLDAGSSALETAIGSSWDTLEAVGQRVLVALAAVGTPLDHELAISLVARAAHLELEEARRAVAVLRARSLLSSSDVSSGSVSLLETIREFALSRTTEEAQRDARNAWWQTLGARARRASEEGDPTLVAPYAESLAELLDTACIGPVDASLADAAVWALSVQHHFLAGAVLFNRAGPPLVAALRERFSANGVDTTTAAVFQCIADEVALRASNWQANAEAQRVDESTHPEPLARLWALYNACNLGYAMAAADTLARYGTELVRLAPKVRGLNVASAVAGGVFALRAAGVHASSSDLVAALERIPEHMMPFAAQAYETATRACLVVGDHDGALALLSQIERRKPASPTDLVGGTDSRVWRALLHLDRGELGDAKALYERIRIDLLLGVPDVRLTRLWGVVCAGLTIIHLLHGHEALAAHAAQELLEVPLPANTRALAAYALARAGRLAEARAVLETVSIGPAQGNGVGRRVAELWCIETRALLGEPVDINTVATLRGAAAATAGHELNTRLAMRVLESALTRSARSADASSRPRGWILDEAGAWITVPSGMRVDLTTKQVLGRILVALTRRHLEAPESHVTNDALIASVWQGERMRYDAGLGRLRSHILRLRHLGLDEIIETVAGGYRIKPGADISLGNT